MQQSIEQRVSRGLIILAIRQVITYGSIFFGNLLLSRWVDPATYGVFAAALAFQNTIMILGDGGIGLALIQRDKEPEDRELAALFTLQLLLFSTIATIVWFAAPWLSERASLGSSGVTLIRSLAIVLSLTAFRTNPAMLLERKLQFNAVATAEAISTILYQVVLLIMIRLDFDIFSIVGALAVRYVSDLLIINSFHLWIPRLSFQFKPIMSYVWFSLNMQTLRILGYIKDYLPALVLLPLLGSASTGYWTWSIAYIGIPVYFNRLVDRVMFPAYSRAQHDRVTLSKLATLAIWMNFSMGLPVLAVLVVFADKIIPQWYGPDWLTALPVVLLLIPNMISSFVTSSLFPVLYSTNRTRQAILAFGIWVVLTVTFGATGLFIAGLQGLALAFSISTVIIALLLIFLTRSIVDLQLWQSFAGPVIAICGAIITSIWLHNSSLPWVVSGIVTVAVFGCILIVASYRQVLDLSHNLLTRT